MQYGKLEDGVGFLLAWLIIYLLRILYVIDWYRFFLAIGAISSEWLVVFEHFGNLGEANQPQLRLLELSYPTLFVNVVSQKFGKIAHFCEELLQNSPI